MTSTKSTVARIAIQLLTQPAFYTQVNCQVFVTRFYFYTTLIFDLVEKCIHTSHYEWLRSEPIGTWYRKIAGFERDSSINVARFMVIYISLEIVVSTIRVKITLVFMETKKFYKK